MHASASSSRTLFVSKTSGSVGWSKSLFEFELAATFRVPLGDKLIAGGIIID